MSSVSRESWRFQVPLDWLSRIPGMTPFLKEYLFIWLCEVLVEACGISFLGQGSNLGPLHWECGVSATGPPGKSQSDSFSAEIEGMEERMGAEADIYR